VCAPNGKYRDGIPFEEGCDQYFGDYVICLMGLIESAMVESWPPEKYSEPNRFGNHPRRIILTAVVLVVFSGLLVRNPLKSTSRIIAGELTAFFNAYGVDNLIVAVVVSLAVLLAWIFGSTVFVIVVHEAIHYVVGALLSLNPRFEWSKMDGVPIQNPTVVAYSIGIRRWQVLALLIAPFLLLSVVCGSLIFLGSGFVSGTASVMFLANAVPSCSDVYKSIRIVRLDKGTLFANFDTPDGLKSEYVIPK